MARLDDHQCGALRNLFNTSVGKSSAVMSKLLGEEVLLSVPQVSFLRANEAAHHLSTANMYCIRQPFKGAFSGDALFVFPGSKSLEVVRKVVGALVAEQEIPSMAHDVMTVVGHIVLSSCISSLSQIFHKEFDCGALTFKMESGEKILGPTDQNTGAMFLRIRFVLRNGPIESFAVLVLNTTSLHVLRTAASRLVDSSMPYAST